MIFYLTPCYKFIIILGKKGKDFCMKYSDLDTGQIYGDYVILGFSLDNLKKSMLGSFHLRESDYRLLFGYWYFKDKQYLKDFLDRCLMNILHVILVKKDLSDNTIYELGRGKPDEFVFLQEGTSKRHIFNPKLVGIKEKSEITNYLLKYNLVHTNNKCYTKEQIFDKIKQYVFSTEFINLSTNWYKSLYVYFVQEAKFNWNYTNYIDTKGIILDDVETELPSEFLLAPLILKDSYGYISEINLEWLKNRYYSNLKIGNKYIETLDLVTYCAYGPYVDSKKLPNSLDLYPLEENKDIHLEFERYLRSLASWYVERK